MPSHLSEASSPTSSGTCLAAHTLLSGPRAAEAPERDILTHALGGNLDEKTLDRLLAAAATAQMVNAYRVDLALRSEHVLVGEWHRQLEGGCADEILDAVRGKFQAAADQIARAPTLIPMQSSPEHILATAGDGALEAWRTLDEHIRIVDVIGTRIAAQFGPRLGAFPQVTEFPLGDGPGWRTGQSVAPQAIWRSTRRCSANPAPTATAHGVRPSCG